MSRCPTLPCRVGLALAHCLLSFVSIAAACNSSIQFDVPQDRAGVMDGGGGGEVVDAAVGGSRCSFDEDCPGRRCDVPSGACVECLIGNDCASRPNLPRCDLGRKICVQCLASTDCRDDDAPICNRLTGRCVDQNGNESDGDLDRADARQDGDLH